MLPRQLALSLLVTIASSLSAQRMVVRPLVVPAGDTTDHIDLTWHGAPAHATAIAVALVYDAEGNQLTGIPVHWSSSDTTVASVSGTSTNGIVLARGFGSATIRASVGSMHAKTLACVYGPTFPLGVVVSGPATIPLGQTRQYIASTNTGVLFPAPCVHWSTTDPGAASVTRRGLVTGLSISANRSDVTAFLGVP